MKEALIYSPGTVCLTLEDFDAVFAVLQPLGGERLAEAGEKRSTLPFPAFPQGSV